VTHLGHFPPSFPHHFHLPRTVPPHAVSLHYSQTPPNHHEITTKRPPPAHTNHLRPLHSSPPRHFFTFPLFHCILPQPSQPHFHKTNFLQFLFCFDNCTLLVQVCSCLWVGFLFFCRGLEIFGAWLLPFGLKVAHHLFDKSPDRLPRCLGPLLQLLKLQTPVPNLPIQLLSNERSFLRRSLTLMATSKILKPPNGRSRKSNATG
jgi:hypothetical protein